MYRPTLAVNQFTPNSTGGMDPFLAPAVTVGETEGAMDSTSGFFCL